MDDNIRKLISDWYRRCRQSQRLNYETGNLYVGYHYKVGIATIVFEPVLKIV